MTELCLGAATLEHEQTGRPDSDAVDATLAASGDASAFERLYRHHLPRIYSLVRRMLNDDDADEVTQDVFVRAWQKLGTFRGEAAFGTWLHRLAVNVILARRETLGTRRKRYLEGDAVLEIIPSPPATDPSWHGFRVGHWNVCLMVPKRCSCCTMSRDTGTRK